MIYLVPFASPHHFVYHSCHSEPFAGIGAGLGRAYYELLREETAHYIVKASRYCDCALITRAGLLESLRLGWPEGQKLWEEVVPHHYKFLQEIIDRTDMSSELVAMCVVMGRDVSLSLDF